MTTLPSYFLDALRKIEPDEDAENARDAHAEVRKVLKESDELKKLGIDPILIGSYARSVSIKRVKDVDLFARLDDGDGELQPGATLKLFEEALATYGDRLSPQARSFKVDFPDMGLAVDVVPARPKGDHWEIPKKVNQDDRASWVETTRSSSTPSRSQPTPSSFSVIAASTSRSSSSFVRSGVRGADFSREASATR